MQSARLWSERRASLLRPLMVDHRCSDRLRGRHTGQRLIEPSRPYSPQGPLCGGGVGRTLNAAVVSLESFGWIFLVRFATGMALAGVYPTAMKIVSGWFQEGRGAVLGTMIAALTLGSGSPHLLRSVFVDNWEATVFGSSLLAVGGGLLVLSFGADGPFDIGGARFNPRTMLTTLTDRG